MKRLLLPLTISLLLAPLFAAATTTCPNLYRNLSFGSRGSDVIELQTFLIAQGDLAAGYNTGYYGNLTLAAVKNWQVRNGIVSSGTAATTGFGAVGPRTRAKIASVCGGGGGTVLSTDFSAFPVSGSAALTVRFSYQGDAGVDGYSLDFGDYTTHGTMSHVNPSLTHTYATSGTYTAKLNRSLPTYCYPNGSCLSVDRFETIGTVTITVVGNAGDAPANTKLSASPTSGRAPLSVTFSAEGIANNWTDPQTGMSVSISDQGDRYIDFGDGSAHQKLVCYAAPPCRVSMTHIYQTMGTYRATLFTAGYYGIENDPVYRTRSDEAQLTVTAQ